MRRRESFEKSTWAFGLFLAGLFLFRLFFGLSTDLWFIDQHQIYLIGLKFYSTDAWPYFGPDVAYQIQLPGALQGLAVGLPLFLCPEPESPFVALALLSFAGLGFLAWYFHRQLPQFPFWIPAGFTLTLPWVLNWSTNIDNDSYALFGGCLFFVGFLESLPAFRLGIWPYAFSFYLMGFSLLWCAQFHMSYVLLAPFLAVAAAWQWKRGLKEIAWSGLNLGLGCLTTGIFVLPTYLKYGLASGSGGMAKAVHLNPGNFLSFFTVLGRFFSLASFEIPRFIGAHTADRLNFLNQNAWLWPFALILLGFWIFSGGRHGGFGVSSPQSRCPLERCANPNRVNGAGHLPEFSFRHQAPRGPHLLHHPAPGAFLRFLLFHTLGGAPLVQALALGLFDLQSDFSLWLGAGSLQDQISLPQPPADRTGHPNQKLSIVREAPRPSALLTRLENP